MHSRFHDSESRSAAAFTTPKAAPQLFSRFREPLNSRFYDSESHYLSCTKLRCVSSDNASRATSSHLAPRSATRLALRFWDSRRIRLRHLDGRRDSATQLALRFGDSRRVTIRHLDGRSDSATRLAPPFWDLRRIMLRHLDGRRDSAI